MRILKNMLLIGVVLMVASLAIAWTSASDGKPIYEVPAFDAGGALVVAALVGMLYMHLARELDAERRSTH